VRTTPLQDLVRRAAANDQAAWDDLVRRFRPYVRAVCRSHRLSDSDAADVEQNTWLRLLEHIAGLERPDRVGAWLATTARRECLAVLRRGVREVPSDPSEFEPVCPAPRADARLLAAERDAALWKAVGCLPPRSQRLLLLTAVEPAPSYEELGRVLEMPVGSIGPTRGRCLRRLQQDTALARLAA
jgi:RNA polymerase sigma factor (sigma-70 family)